MNLREYWREQTDDEVAAAGRVLSAYEEDAQQVIRAEMRRRGIVETPVAEQDAPSLSTPGETAKAATVSTSRVSIEDVKALLREGEGSPQEGGSAKQTAPPKEDIGFGLAWVCAMIPILMVIYVLIDAVRCRWRIAFQQFAMAVGTAAWMTMMFGVASVLPQGNKDIDTAYGAVYLVGVAVVVPMLMFHFLRGLDWPRKRISASGPSRKQ
jgi:hypothetical protein